MIAGKCEKCGYEDPPVEPEQQLWEVDAASMSTSDVRELQGLVGSAVEALGLIRAQTWQFLDALDIPHDTSFVEVLRRVRTMRPTEPAGDVKTMAVRQMTETAFSRFIEAFRQSHGDQLAKLAAGSGAVLRYGIATGVAVERGHVVLRDEVEGDPTGEPNGTD
jgi:hypothetical protein